MSSNEAKTEKIPLQQLFTPPPGRYVPPPPPPSNILPSTPLNQPNGTLPNTPLAISFISVGLATLVVLPLTLVAAPYLSFGFGWARPQLGLYLACVGMFHLLEFWTTAGWNPAKLSVDCMFFLYADRGE
jgi:protein-S-isoprenylcysteine O-methyltransferase